MFGVCLSPGFVTMCLVKSFGFSFIPVMFLGLGVVFGTSYLAHFTLLLASGYSAYFFCPESNLYFVVFINSRTLL